MNEFKKRMKEKIKLYSNKEYLDGYMKNEYMTHDNDADIFLKLRSRDELFDRRTVNNQVDVVKDVYEYIEDKTSMLDSDVKIELHILGLNLSSSEQEKVRHIIKEHYAIELYKIQKEYIRFRNKIFKLILIGLFSLLSYAFLYFYTDFEFLMEMFIFLFSFALWESFDSIIYNFNEVKEERKNITQNLLTEVSFDENEKDVI